LQGFRVFGDVLPDALAASLTKGELDAMLAIGKLVEVGAKPAPRPPEPPRRPLTVAEILRNTEAWPRADVVGGQVIEGPRGYKIEVLGKPARHSDLRKVSWSGGETPILVHPVDGQLVASISLIRLAQLLGAATFGHHGPR
jgi:hypothetical protein